VLALVNYQQHTRFASVRVTNKMLSKRGGKKGYCTSVVLKLFLISIPAGCSDHPVPTFLEIWNILGLHFSSEAF